MRGWLTYRSESSSLFLWWARPAGSAVDVAADHADSLEHRRKRARDRELVDRVRELPILDPESLRSLREVPGHPIRARPENGGEVEPMADAREDLPGLDAPGSR